MSFTSNRGLCCLDYMLLVLRAVWETIDALNSTKRRLEVKSTSKLKTKYVSRATAD